VKPKTAVASVCALLAAASVASYVVGDGLARLARTERLPRPLAVAIPAQLGGWTGTDDPLPEKTVATLKVDDYVKRQYRGANGELVLLYVAYHGNKQTGMDTFYHNVDICFPSAGWTRESQKTGSETLHDAAKEIPVCRYVFAKDGKQLSVLTFFKVDDEFLDQSPRNKPFWMLIEKATPQFDDSPGTFVQVQVVTRVGEGGEFEAAEVQSRFVREFGPLILKAVERGAPE
jgi:EpsI family protein